MAQIKFVLWSILVFHKKKDKKIEPKIVFVVALIFKLVHSINDEEGIVFVVVHFVVS